MTLIDQLNHIDLAIAQCLEKLENAQKRRDQCLPWSQAQWDADSRCIHLENTIEDLERSYTSVALGEIEV